MDKIKLTDEQVKKKEKIKKEKQKQKLKQEKEKYYAFYDDVKSFSRDNGEW